ncbi:mucin-20 [Vicugna pacos]|uniref:Mucin-20 n=1 Tax=Vicugna pacos TaxID=30538 RepID=A0A6J0AGJ6_VICPA|nr:mucin-20 [Vicugna pacos]
MGSFWGLTLPLFFFFYLGAGAPRSSAGPSTSGSGHTEVPAVTSGSRTSSEGVFWTTDLTKTSDRTLIPDSIIPEAETRETETIFPATQIRALIKRTLSKFTVVITTPVETSATSGSPTGSGVTAAETVTCDHLLKAIFDILCTFDSSEEAKRVMVNVLTWAHTSAEAEALSSESSASSDSSASAFTSFQGLSPDITALAKALAANNITNFEVTNCSVLDIETTAPVPRTSDVDHSPTGGKALSAPETSALPDSTEARSHLPRTTTSAKVLSAASATASATPDVTSTIDSTAKVETTAAKATTPSGNLVTVSMNPLKENSVLSVETTSHTEDSGAVTISTGAGSTVGKVTSPARFSATVYSLSEVATIVSSTLSEPSTTDSTFSGTVPISKSPLPSVHLTTASSSQGKNITLAKTTASVKTLKTTSTAQGKPSAAMPTTAQTRWTDATAGRDGGFLLLRLSVDSPEDLTDPRVVERLMQQLHRELCLPLIRVSLLRVRRS